MSSENSTEKLDRVVAEALNARKERESGYRSRALKMYPWVCGRCAREFNQENLQELTVHHRNHDHDDNPPDGSNWELLCIYCHDNEHSRTTDSSYGEFTTETQNKDDTHHPFADLASLIKKKDQ